MRSAILLCLTSTLCALASACVSPKPIRYYRIDLPQATTAAGSAFPVTLAVGTIDSPPVMKDGRILSDFPTDEDPIHREYVNRAAVAARLAAERTGVHEPTGAAP